MRHRPRSSLIQRKLTMRSQYASVLRYFAALLGSVAVIAGSVVLLLEAPTSASAARADTPTVAALKRAIEQPKALPVLTARDFDISRTVKVEVKGKAEPQTVPAPTQTALATAPEGSGPSAIVTADAVNLRAFANKGSTRVGVVRHGTRVTVLETERSWSRVRAEDGQTGWLATKFLRQ